MNTKTIYLVFTRTGTWLSNVIYWFTSDEYVHVSISFDKTFSEMYSLGRKNPRNPFSGGLVKENIHDGVFKNFSNSKCLIYKLDVTETQFNTLKQSIDFHYNQREKYRYNFLGLLALHLNIPLKRDDYYFCSEFISELFIESGIHTTTKLPQFMKPLDLLEIPNKEFIYEGYINEYKTTNTLAILHN